MGSADTAMVGLQSLIPKPVIHVRGYVYEEEDVCVLKQDLRAHI